MAHHWLDGAPKPHNNDLLLFRSPDRPRPDSVRDVRGFGVVVSWQLRYYTVVCLTSSGTDCGDIIHVQSVQFAKPELTWEFDADQNTARSTRQQMLTRAVEPNVFVAGAHLDFPGVGKVVRSSDSFLYEGL